MAVARRGSGTAPGRPAGATPFTRCCPPLVRSGAQLRGGHLDDHVQQAAAQLQHHGHKPGGEAQTLFFVFLLCFWILTKFVFF